MISKFILLFLFFTFSNLSYAQFTEITIGNIHQSVDLLSENKKDQISSISLKILGNSTTTKVLLTILGIILLLGCSIYFNWVKKNRFTYKKYKEFIKKVSSEKEQNHLNEAQKTLGIQNYTNITDDTVQSIIIKLEKFEKSDKYLRKDISMTWLANHFNTNTKYLSEIIKNHKSKNFSNYINGLRIDYIVQKLAENPVYRDYKIGYLAEECGYSSRQVFVNSFKKETGFAPSYFIEDLKKRQYNLV